MKAQKEEKKAQKEAKVQKEVKAQKVEVLVDINHIVDQDLVGIIIYIISRGGKKEEGRSILIRSLPFEAKVDELREIFSKYGTITDVYIPKDYNTRKPRGFGFVEFKDPDDVKEALEQLQGYKMGDRELVLQEAQNRRKKPSEYIYIYL